MLGCSDDGFEYFRCWLISQGKDVFENALRNPDSLVKAFAKLKQTDNIPELEEMLYVCTQAYTMKFQLTEDEGMEQYSEVQHKLSTSVFSLPEITFDWNEEDEESMKKICPNVFKKYRDDPF